MNAYDKGSNARHGPAGQGVPDPRPELPDPAVPADTPGPRIPPPDPAVPAAPPGPRIPVPGPGGPADRPPEPRSPAADGIGTGASVPGPPAERGTGVAALSLRYRIGAAVALAVVAAGVCVHLGMTFLHVAPSNTVSKEHAETIESWIYPEFEQNWKLFAPNPLQQNIAVQVRAEVRTADGEARTTGWYDLSAQDGRAIDGNLLPSHTQQNELRRAWDFFVSTHDNDNRPVGLRGALSEAYIRRIVALRLHRVDAAGPGGVVDRVQVRSRTANVPPPQWSREHISTTPVYRTLPWWYLPADEARGGVG
ncbi:DUF5819 family protein [Streptomyces griseoloalbus]|uniref:Uncharacterized protein n=1 Tax=Streptomyces griseoloalbus TaxID=67303 RepID=A0A7W8BRJ4_9ACTN|nr:DUF5819 family protein [Streptomyces albaduncus]MBB5127647.1 hypothetical protein [Streptomyces albaduncus]GGW62220.1 hypothetical protein GCM10010340_45630 [Streptomyces albaduncus]